MTHQGSRFCPSLPPGAPPGLGPGMPSTAPAAGCTVRSGRAGWWVTWGSRWGGTPASGRSPRSTVISHTVYSPYCVPRTASPDRLEHAGDSWTTLSTASGAPGSESTQEAAATTAGTGLDIGMAPDSHLPDAALGKQQPRRGHTHASPSRTESLQRSRPRPEDTSQPGPEGHRG